MRCIAVAPEGDRMNVDFEPRLIREHERVRRRTLSNGKPLLVTHLQKRRNIADRYDDVDIKVRSGLSAQKCIYTPTAVEPYRDISVVQKPKQINNG